MKLGYLGQRCSGPVVLAAAKGGPIGISTGARAFRVLSAFGVLEANTATAWGLAFVTGLSAPARRRGLAPGRPERAGRGRGHEGAAFALD